MDMQANVVIKQLFVGDEERLRQIRLRSLLDAPDAFGSTYEETQGRPATSWTQQLSKLTTFVAVKDGHDVGIVRGDRDDSDAGRLWLCSMWVAPDFRGKGVSTGLVQACIEWAQTTGARELVLEVGAHNERAMELYKRMGFSLNGVTRRLPEPRSHIVEQEMVYSLGKNGE